MITSHHQLMLSQSKGCNLDTEEEITREPSDDAPFSALAFKVMTDPYVGKLTFFRVYSGTAQAGSYVKNSTKGMRERLGRTFKCTRNSREEIPMVYAGDIAAAVGLKERLLVTRFAQRKTTSFSSQ